MGIRRVLIGRSEIEGPASLWQDDTLRLGGTDEPDEVRQQCGFLLDLPLAIFALSDAVLADSGQPTRARRQIRN